MSEISLEELKRGRKSDKEVENMRGKAPHPVLYKNFIKDSKELIDEASELIRKYQTGELQPIKFSRDFINVSLLGGLFPGNVIGIAGSSGHGKSTLLQDLEDDIFDKNLNPKCDDYILLRNNYEMSVFKLYLREIKKGLDKKIADILGAEYTEDEQRIVNKIQDKESNPRIKYFQNPQDPENWFNIMCSFCEEYKDKEHIIVTIDHIALVKQTAFGKKDGIDNLIEYINLLRHVYKNVSFLILSQLNRNIEERDNPKTSAPKKGDLYQSDFLYQLSDIIIVVHNPYKLGLQEHMVVGQSMYPHLYEFKKDPGKKTTTFVTKGNIFFHFIKLREDENQSLPDVYIEKLTTSKSKSSFEREAQLPKMEPNAALFEDEETPFD